jgi:hypothetical protein
MDSRGPITAFGLAAAFCAASWAQSASPLRESQWSAAIDRVRFHTEEPTTCSKRPDDPNGRALFAVGEAAFHAPLLLGGQAARAGISCASCHRNGRGNPDFVFPGVSSTPGTADVTSSVLSSHRGDQKFNPVVIPDLAAPSQKIGRDAGNPTLSKFIRGLIVEEFDGPEPTPTVLDGLTAFVRAQNSAACNDRSVPVTFTLHLARANGAVASAKIAVANGDKMTALFLISAARSQLGLIHERFNRPGLDRQRAIILRYDAALAKYVADASKNKRTRSFNENPPLMSKQNIAFLAHGASKSLYSRDVLIRALAAR